MDNRIAESRGVADRRMPGPGPEKYRACLEGWGDSFVNLPERIDFRSAGKITESRSRGGISRKTEEMPRMPAGGIVSAPVWKACLRQMFDRLKTPSPPFGGSSAGVESGEPDTGMSSVSGFVRWPGRHVFLFGRDAFNDLSEAPRGTGVRRAVPGIPESGERPGSGGMLLFPEAPEWFGTSCYRRNCML